MASNFIDWYRNLLRNSKYRWLIILGTLAYLLSPIDLLPDVIPVIGQIDDVVILTLLVTEVSQVLMERVRTVKGKNSTAVADKSATDSVDVNAIHVE
ncbi:MAG: DUF1232 domain-containing protein [Synechococcales cyanobacterium C42_A2020_086]|jgi:uncharacterized membrane protein YkvA (DUF1232 family)|nr:DUF1232 domain-containing protein [Synechococcales cyanobacterium M58_A2018_015]MBF2072762.1 DUF1232 domain-containing protein [Synechococcales cyanobacterium C42_A2020_086]